MGRSKEIKEASEQSTECTMYMSTERAKPMPRSAAYRRSGSEHAPVAVGARVPCESRSCRASENQFSYELVFLLLSKEVLVFC